MRRISVPLYALSLAGGVALGVVVLALALRSDTRDEATIPVLVARGLIPAGTPAEDVFRFMVVPTSLPRREFTEQEWDALTSVKPPSMRHGARPFNDGHPLSGRVTIVDIYPGGMLKSEFFGLP